MTPLVQIQPPRPRLPEWARRPSTHFESLNKLKSGLRALKLHTVCESARCPNIHECFHRGAATFMILGNLCTRGCGFCSVPKGNPRIHDMQLDPAEPGNVARMAAEMKLRYVVITSVNRDDLADGGSAHFAQTVREVKQALPDARVEVLTPDFDGLVNADLARGSHELAGHAYCGTGASLHAVLRMLVRSVDQSISSTLRAAWFHVGESSTRRLRARPESLLSVSRGVDTPYPAASKLRRAAAAMAGGITVSDARCSHRPRRESRYRRDDGCRRCRRDD